MWNYEEIARKHCGAKAEWKIGLEKLKLKLKCGSMSNDREFRRLIQKIVDEDVTHGHMPDYAIEINGNFVIFRGRGSVPCPVEETFDVLLGSSIYEDARVAAPGWDVRYIEQEWRKWCAAEEIVPKNPERHFIKFCLSWFENRGKP